VYQNRGAALGQLGGPGHTAEGVASCNITSDLYAVGAGPSRHLENLESLDIAHQYGHFDREPIVLAAFSQKLCAVIN
jgi:hypothetical protein